MVVLNTMHSQMHLAILTNLTSPIHSMQLVSTTKTWVIPSRQSPTWGTTTFAKADAKIATSSTSTNTACGLVTSMATTASHQQLQVVLTRTKMASLATVITTQRELSTDLTETS